MIWKFACGIYIGEEQLILFLLVPFLHQVCHAWPSTLPLKMTMSWPTFCKFWQLDKSPIDFQNAISVCHVNNKALIHLNCQYQHSLQSSIPITKTCKKWVMTLSSSMAMYSFMRDIPDARKVPMERGWVALYLYATCKFSNLLTLEQWAFEYGLPLFWYALYRRWKLYGFRCFLMLSETYFEAFWYKTEKKKS